MRGWCGTLTVSSRWRMGWQRNIHTRAGLNENLILPSPSAERRCRPESREIRGWMRREVWLPRHGTQETILATTPPSLDQINPRRAPTTRRKEGARQKPRFGQSGIESDAEAFNFQTEEDSTLRSQGSGRHGGLLCWLMLGDHSSLSGSGEASGPDPHMTYLASGGGREYNGHDSPYSGAAS